MAVNSWASATCMELKGQPLILELRCRSILPSGKLRKNRKGIRNECVTSACRSFSCDENIGWRARVTLSKEGNPAERDDAGGNNNSYYKIESHNHHDARRNSAQRLVDFPTRHPGTPSAELQCNPLLFEPGCASGGMHVVESILCEHTALTRNKNGPYSGNKGIVIQGLRQAHVAGLGTTHRPR